MVYVLLLLPILIVQSISMISVAAETSVIDNYREVYTLVFDGKLGPREWDNLPEFTRTRYLSEVGRNVTASFRISHNITKESFTVEDNFFVRLLIRTDQTFKSELGDRINIVVGRELDNSSKPQPDDLWIEFTREYPNNDMRLGIQDLKCIYQGVCPGGGWTSQPIGCNIKGLTFPIDWRYSFNDTSSNWKGWTNEILISAVAFGRKIKEDCSDEWGSKVTALHFKTRIHVWIGNVCKYRQGNEKDHPVGVAITYSDRDIPKTYMLHVIHFATKPLPPITTTTTTATTTSPSTTTTTSSAIKPTETGIVPTTPGMDVYFWSPIVIAIASLIIAVIAIVMCIRGRKKQT